MKPNWDALLPKFMFGLSLGAILIAYGYAIHRNHIFPYSLLAMAKPGFEQILSSISDHKPKHYKPSANSKVINIVNASEIEPGLTLITETGVSAPIAKVIDSEGNIIHQWDLDWFRIWPDANHLPEYRVPKSPPGAQIHGAILLKGGDLIFNYDYLGLVRVNICGDVIWKMPYQTHHSIFLSEDSTLWVGGRKYYDKPIAKYPNLTAPVNEDLVLHVTLDGEILEETSVFDILERNNLQHLMYMQSLSGDLYHLNDIDVFPNDWEEGVFKNGDVMISLRQLNTIIVYDRWTYQVKHIISGGFVRQHDPDFRDGNTISVFNNNNIGPASDGIQSNILIKSLNDDQTFLAYAGSKHYQFYTQSMGKHQWLSNGNILISDTKEGKAFEVNKDSKVVWEYNNIIGKGYFSDVSEANRLPIYFTKEKFDSFKANCSKSK